ncbi:MAG: ricin-type beta-trefoil lectin domain protein [Paracoccaceae bacterium]|nr:ricin-type beta-trefoil lectin domain protein [Paracoccaceae bacterium]
MNVFEYVIAAAVIVTVSHAASAEEAVVQTPAPVIHLQDNLDEADGLGWCLDTQGRGYAETLHAHSCKPRGGDVQFSFDSAKAEIRPVAFPDKCVVALPQDAHTEFGLADCDGNDPAQRFSYRAETLSLYDQGNPARCIAVGAASRSAGPYMSRDLVWADCRSPEPDLRRWIVRD